jgi:hypothetical protein
MGKYKVGYGKPPVGSRFKPGQSGNPAGRAHGARPRSTEKVLCDWEKVWDHVGPVDALPKTRGNFGLRAILRPGLKDPGAFMAEVINSCRPPVAH